MMAMRNTLKKSVLEMQEKEKIAKITTPAARLTA